MTRASTAESGGALVSVYDKTGLEELARGLARGGRRDRLDRLDGRADRRGRRPGHRGRGRHRLPGDPRRPGQDAAPARPRRPARRPEPTPRTSREARRARASSRSTCSSSQPLPVPADRAVRRRARPRSSSRSTSAARRWCGRRRRTTRASPSSSTRRATARCWTPSARGGFDLAQRAACWRRGRSRTPPPTTSPSPPGRAACSPTPTDGTGFPAFTGATWERARRAAVRREPAPAGGAVPALAARGAWRTPSSCTARRCRTTTTSTPTPPGAPPTTTPRPCVAIIKHANPCGIAVGADLADGLRARPSPATRSRRTAAWSRSTAR